MKKTVLVLALDALPFAVHAGSMPSQQEMWDVIQQ